MWGCQTLQMSGQPALGTSVSGSHLWGTRSWGAQVPLCDLGLLSFYGWTGSAMAPAGGEYFLFGFFLLEVSLKPGKLFHTQTWEGGWGPLSIPRQDRIVWWAACLRGNVYWAGKSGRMTKPEARKHNPRATLMASGCRDRLCFR